MRLLLYWKSVCKEIEMLLMNKFAFKTTFSYNSLYMQSWKQCAPPPPYYRHNSFMATGPLGHMMYVYHFPKCMSCKINQNGTLFSWLHICYAHLPSVRFEHSMCRGPLSLVIYIYTYIYIHIYIYNIYIYIYIYR